MVLDVFSRLPELAADTRFMAEFHRTEWNISFRSRSVTIFWLLLWTQPETNFSRIDYISFFVNARLSSKILVMERISRNQRCKWNKDAAAALQQIKNKRYPESILTCTGDILLVGINYDKDTKEHQHLYLCNQA